MDPLFLALSKLRRRKHDECIAVCSSLLEQNAYDQGAWYVKARATTAASYIDDTDMEDEGVAEILLDENAMSSAPRPGTSLARPMSSANKSTGGFNQGVRPMTNSGRPLSGFARPGTQSRGGGGGGSKDVASAFGSGRPGTSRPVSVQGRFVRLGTASLLSSGGDPARFINADAIDLKRYVKRPALAKVLCDYLLYHEHNAKKALELCSEATIAADYKDWWWKARLGKAYYQLGMYRDAEKQFQSALRQQEMVVTYLELAKVYLRLDQPNAALDLYARGSEKFPGDIHLMLGAARVHEALNDLDAAIAIHKRVLMIDASNAEAIACLASHHFYTDQPEVALRFYRRLLQMGINNTELWNNIGLCCFYASQYDMTLSCFEKALALASDDNMADVWYNVGHVAIGLGDLNLAYQALKVAISVDSSHSEAFNNIGVLELRKGAVEQAKANFANSASLSAHSFEPFFNSALLSFKLGDCQESFEAVTKSIAAYAEHSDSHELVKQLKKHFAHL